MEKKKRKKERSSLGRLQIDEEESQENRQPEKEFWSQEVEGDSGFAQDEEPELPEAETWGRGQRVIGGVDAVCDEGQEDLQEAARQ